MDPVFGDLCSLPAGWLAGVNFRAVEGELCMGGTECQLASAREHASYAICKSLWFRASLSSFSCVRHADTFIFASGLAGGSTAIISAAASSATTELFRWGENSAMARAMEVRLFLSIRSTIRTDDHVTRRSPRMGRNTCSCPSVIACHGASLYCDGAVSTTSPVSGSVRH